MATSYQFEPALQTRSRMRAVTATAKGDCREILRRTLAADPVYELIAEAGTQEECAEVVARECPDLVICGDSCAPALSHEPAALPVLIAIGWLGPAAPERVVCEIGLPLRESDVVNALAMAAQRILQIELSDLCLLVEAHTAHSVSRGEPADRIIVDSESGQQISLAIGDILWIKAAGNYVRLFTRAGTFELRETMTHIASKLEHCGFLRIHRRTVVNAGAIRGRHISDGIVRGLILIDGTQLPVGPNFRYQFEAGAKVLPINQAGQERWLCSE